MCTSPVEAFQLKQQYWPNKDKAPQPVFGYPQPQHKYNKLQLKCTKCIACVKVHTMGRAIQMFCELQTNIEAGYTSNQFLTTSYDDENIPPGHTLVKQDHTDYIKRVRNHRVKTNQSGKLRYEHKAEYGTTTNRPHNHYAMFNLGNIPDLEIWQEYDDYNSYTSEIQTEIWGKGRVIIIPLTLASCVYVAQHVYKKINRIPAHERTFFHPKTGQIIPPPKIRVICDKKTGELIDIIKGRVPEYPTQSNKPGIGSDWFDKYQSDLSNNTIVPSDLIEHKIPEYFYNKMKKVNPELFEIFKLKNEIYALENQKTSEENAYQANYDEIELKQKKSRTKI